MVDDKYKKALEQLVNDLNGLISESLGVSGLHLNGDLADWSELLEGGHLESWLKSLAEAERVLKSKG